MAHEVITEVAVIVLACYSIATTVLLSLEIKKLKKKVHRLQAELRSHIFIELIEASKDLGLYEKK